MRCLSHLLSHAFNLIVKCVEMVLHDLVRNYMLFKKSSVLISLLKNILQFDLGVSPFLQLDAKLDTVMTSSPRDGIGPEADRLMLSHWAGPSVTRSAKLSQSFYRGIIIVILTKGKPVPLAWEFIYKLGEVTRVTSTILPNMGRKCVTEA